MCSCDVLYAMYRTQAVGTMLPVGTLHQLLLYEVVVQVYLVNSYNSVMLSPVQCPG